MFFQKIVVTIAFAIFTALFPMADPAHGLKQIPARVAFERDGNVWVYVNGTEIQLSKSGKAMGAEWSVDGKFLAYVDEGGGEPPQQSVHIYDVSARETIKIYKNVPIMASLS